MSDQSSDNVVWATVALDRAITKHAHAAAHAALDAGALVDWEMMRKAVKVDIDSDVMVKLYRQWAPSPKEEKKLLRCIEKNNKELLLVSLASFLSNEDWFERFIQDEYVSRLEKTVLMVSLPQQQKLLNAWPDIIKKNIFVHENFKKGAYPNIQKMLNMFSLKDNLNSSSSKKTKPLKI